MATHTALCPRCGRVFHCGVHGALRCACTTVTLSNEQLAALLREFSGCLCLDCLQSLAAGGTPAQPATAAPPR